MYQYLIYNKKIQWLFTLIMNAFSFSIYFSVFSACLRWQLLHLSSWGPPSRVFFQLFYLRILATDRFWSQHTFVSRPTLHYCLTLHCLELSPTSSLPSITPLEGGISGQAASSPASISSSCLGLDPGALLNHRTRGPTLISLFTSCHFDLCLSMRSFVKILWWRY